MFFGGVIVFLWLFFFAFLWWCGCVLAWCFGGDKLEKRVVDKCWRRVLYIVDKCCSEVL